MAWYPKAIRKEVTKHRTAISGPNRVINHIAVSNSDSLFGFFNSSSVKVCSHFYVRFDGKVEQYVDTKYRAPANLEANSDSISIETAGGVTNANTTKWTTAQVNALIELNRWICNTHNIPKVLLPDSKAGRRGIGYHRLGVDPWRVSGGQKWSNAYGKICPGQGKIDQMPGIVRAVSNEEDMPLNDADKAWINSAIGARVREELDRPIKVVASGVETNVRARDGGRYAFLGMQSTHEVKSQLGPQRVISPGVAAYIRDVIGWIDPNDPEKARELPSRYLLEHTFAAAHQMRPKLAALEALVAEVVGRDPANSLTVDDVKQIVEQAHESTRTEIAAVTDLLAQHSNGELSAEAVVDELTRRLADLFGSGESGN